MVVGGGGWLAGWLAGWLLACGWLVGWRTRCGLGLWLADSLPRLRELLLVWGSFGLRVPADAIFDHIGDDDGLHDDHAEEEALLRELNSPVPAKRANPDTLFSQLSQLVAWRREGALSFPELKRAKVQLGL